MKVQREESIYCDSLQSVIDRADRIIKQNPGMTYKDFTIDKYQADYSDSEYPCMTYEEEETLLEKVVREKREAENKAWREKRDAEEFARLKKKFGESA